MTILNDKIRIEGNSLIIRMQPATGLLALTSFISTEIGVTETAYFDKYFRYSLNGVLFSDWLPLTTQAITELAITPTDTLVIELSYLKIDQVEGESALGIQNVAIEANKTTSLPQNYFDKTVFKKFFDSDSIEVLGWYINILDKLYNKGIIPNYIDRHNINGESNDFLDFWKSIARFFSYFVIYARKFQKFYESESLLSEYLEERGLNISTRNDLTDLNNLMISFYEQIAARGTIRIVDEVEEGKLVDGELLRLIEYKPGDEFIFNPHRSEHFGWNIGNSSPLYRGLYLSDNANKYGDKSFQPYDVTKYQGATIVTDGALSVLSVESTLSHDRIKVSSNMDYEFSFLIKKEAAALLTVRLEAFDKNLNSIDLKSHKDSSIRNSFFSNINLSRSDKYLLIKLFIYNKQKAIFNQDTTNVNQGENLTMSDDTVWITPFIELIGGSAKLYGVRFIPTNTSFSHGLLQVNNWITCAVLNRNKSLMLSEVEDFTRRYLVSYNNRIKTLEIERFADRETEEARDTFSWIGSGQYCERFLWIGDDETAYCEQEAIVTTTTTAAPTTTTTTVTPITTTTTTLTIPIVRWTPGYTEVSLISSKTAIARGEIVSGSGIFERGVCWSMNTSTDPTISDETAISGGVETSFEAIVGLFVDLQIGVQYNVRMYAINDIGIGYSTTFLYTHNYE